MSPYPLPLAPPSQMPFPTHLGGHKALSWSPCAIQLLPTSYLFYIWYCIYVHATLSLHPSLPFPLTMSSSPFFTSSAFNFLKTSLLEYNCFKMVCYFLLYNKVSQLYIYIYPHISSLLRLPPTLPIPPL